MALYFERFDGQAVTIDDFVGAMSDANDFDFVFFGSLYIQVIQGFIHDDHENLVNKHCHDDTRN
jgi:hypothetical protein